MFRAPACRMCLSGTFSRPMNSILYIIAAMVMPEANEVSPRVEKHETDYQTGRPNTMNGDFTKSDNHDEDSNDNQDNKN